MKKHFAILMSIVVLVMAASLQCNDKKKISIEGCWKIGETTEVFCIDKDTCMLTTRGYIEKFEPGNLNIRVRSVRLPCEWKYTGDTLTIIYPELTIDSIVDGIWPLKINRLMYDKAYVHDTKNNVFLTLYKFPTIDSMHTFRAKHRNK